jgi:drug/metabolite transporter (DMT)-like permease
MLSLILSVFCSVSIALILKYNDTKSGNALLLLTGNYFAATLTTLALSFSEMNFDIPLSMLALGAGLAVFFVGSFFAFTKAVNVAGTALATVSSRLSVFLPALLSIIVYKEQPKILHLAAYALVGLTMLLFYKSLKGDANRKLSFADFFYLIALLIGIGIADFGMKIFEEEFAGAGKSMFLFSIFGFSFLYTAAISLYKKVKPERTVLIRGMVLGIPNIFSSFFLIGALETIPGYLTFPFVNIGVIVATGFFARILFKEKLNTYGILSILTGIIAIILMSI